LSIETLNLSTVAIYGTGTFATRLATCLRHAGVEILAFIDDYKTDQLRSVESPVSISQFVENHGRDTPVALGL
jgi:phosphoglycerate dehydrogenase-like enzyme